MIGGGETRGGGEDMNKTENGIRGRDEVECEKGEKRECGERC